MVNSHKDKDLVSLDKIQTPMEMHLHTFRGCPPLQAAGVGCNLAHFMQRQRQSEVQTETMKSKFILEIVLIMKNQFLIPNFNQTISL